MSQEMYQLYEMARESGPVVQSGVVVSAGIAATAVAGAVATGLGFAAQFCKSYSTISREREAAAHNRNPNFRNWTTTPGVNG